MNKTEVMKQLKALGTAQNRKVYARHGFTGAMFGVSYANLGKLSKEIKVNQKLAEQLWATGNHDARIVAIMIADPEKTTVRTLDTWAKESGNRGTAGVLSNLAAKTPAALKRVEKWTKSKNEWIATTGWHTLASLARDDEGLSDKYLERCIDTIEADIHESKNFVRYAMNNALISIGTRNPKLQKKATVAARRIGKVEVDHGQTGCKTPDAVDYIKKTVAYQDKKRAAQKKTAGKKPARKKGTAKRKAAGAAR